MDKYSILGVKPTDDPATIKKAYRRLASKHHPDKGGDPDQFRKIQEAYEAITNPEPEPDFGGWTRKSHPFNFDDIFNAGDFDVGDFARAWAKGHDSNRPNPATYVKTFVSLETAYMGGDVTVELFVQGMGQVKENVYIEPGIRDGTNIRIRGKGRQGNKNAPRGDLVITICIKDYADVMRIEDDLIYNLQVNAIDAILGSEVSVKHLSGKSLNIKIPKGSQSGSKLRLRGYGMPIMHRAEKGDMIVIINTYIPTVTDTETLDLLTKLRNEGNK